jgi:cell division protein FtsW (lipid II flippase)
MKETEQIELTDHTTSEERRQTREKESILKGIIHAVLGFACILVVVVFPVHPEINKTGLPFILSLLIMCTIGVISCYWALNEFLSAYKDRDSLMN